jgi:hypothetical protein
MATITASSGGRTATCAVTVTAGSGLAVNFAGFGDETINLTSNHANDLSRRNYDTLTVSVSDSYDQITWSVDGGDPFSFGNSFNLYASNYPVGIHYLTVVVRTSGAEYFSKELSFRVVE